MNYKGNDKYGALPRRTVIANQPHMLAYINPQEEMLLRQLGGTGQAGPMGVPAYPPGDGGFSPDGGGGYGGGGGFGGFGGSEGGGGYDGPSAAEIANAFAIAEAAVANASVDVDSGMGAAIGSTGGLNDTSFTGTDGASANVTGTDFDSGAGSFDGVSDVGVSDLGVSTETIGGNTGLSGEEFDDIGLVNTTGSGGVSAGVTGADFDFGMGSGTGIDVGIGKPAGEEDVGITIDPYDNPYAIDITDTNIYTENPDGTYTVEDGEPDPIGVFDPNEYIGGPGDGEGGETTTTSDTTPEFVKVEYDFNTSMDPSQYGGMWSNITSTVPKYEFRAYEDADGLLRFSENDELVPAEILKYLPFARKTLVEETETETETETAEAVDDTVDDIVVDTANYAIDETSPVEVTVDPTNTSGATTTSIVGTSMFDNIQALRDDRETVVDTVTPSSTAITNQRADGSDFTDMTTIVEGPTDYSMNPNAIESTIEDRLSDRALGYYDLISGGEKSLYEVNEQSLYNRRNRNPIARQAAQDAVNEYLYNNLTPDELRNWQDGKFNPITDPTSSVYNPQGIPEGLL